MHSILCPHPNSSRTKTSVKGVSVLQGKQGVNLYATVTRNLFIEIKIFVNMLLLLLPPTNENLHQPQAHIQKQE